MTSLDIRKTFLDFFRSKAHTIVPSAPMVVKGDPTLMFTNAGMNQFKDIFLGNAEIKSPRIADSQKCLRVSGKHNDLDEVGHDTYHHTMFEMLGNWSFGDYFKKEAIEWAWELLTEVYGLPKDRLYATIFKGSEEDGVPFDEEAWSYWSKFLPEEQLLLGEKRDNFWEMGDTGPCGPCSEIHFDLRDESERREKSGRELVNEGHPQVIEIWNLVFMQFNRRANGQLEPLPHCHVDTGMGFERLCMVIQGKKSNYDTDVFQPIIQKIAELCGKKYGEDNQTDISMRVIADHLRAISFAIADGQLPSNVKAGYVIRRILRRAVRYGYTYLDFSEPFMYRLIDILVNQMGEQFSEIAAQKTLIESVIREEENTFLRTLATGINLLNEVMARSNGEISGHDAFVLYDTYGFPIDLTELISREAGLVVDIAGFERELLAQKERSRNAAAVENGDWIELQAVKESEFVGYDTLACDAHILRYRQVKTKNKTNYQIVLNRTPFYGASGGQVGDSGVLESNSESIAIIDTLKENGLTIHVTSELPEDLEAQFNARVDMTHRAATESNHSATHLMHEALRSILGTHVEQKGSLVSADYLRFDFSHFQKVTAEQLREVEKQVNAAIRANEPLDENRNMDIEEARKCGAMMLFGEKYGDKVRMVRFGNSTELCGGTHVKATGNIGFFKIVSEGAISAGIRRIEAVTGIKAEELIYGVQDTLQQLHTIFNNPKVVAAAERILSENEELKHSLDELHHEKVVALADKLASEAASDFETRILDMPIPADTARELANILKAKAPRLAIIIGFVADGKVSLSVALGDEVVAKGTNATNIIRTAAKEIEGGGGGQAWFASAGGRKAEGLQRAINIAKQLIEQ